jgi:phage/plasmid-like protein (TIGR03299 family)
MSNETLKWLNENTLVGFTDKRGNAWHYRASLQGEQSNHYPGPIPVPDVERRLFAWDAITSPVWVKDPVTGELATAPGRRAILRGDTGHVLGVFTDGYEPHPYAEWLIGTIARLLDADLSIGSAGLLRGGAVAWVSVEVPENVTTPEGVEFRPHLVGATSFDGSLATTFKRLVTNVVCDNTMATGLAEAGQQVKIKHSRYSKLRIGEARQALNIVYQIADQFAAEVARLCQTTVSSGQWAAFLDAHAPVPAERGRARGLAERKRATLNRLWSHDTRVAPWAGTAFGVVQAVNTYAHHEQTVRGAERAERNMLRAVTGAVDQLDHATLTTLNRVLDRPVLAPAA